MITQWKDLESLKAFAGPDCNNPVVTKDEEPLVEVMFVDHYLRFDKE
jgi:hypothetical protein